MLNVFLFLASFNVELLSLCSKSAIWTVIASFYEAIPHMRFSSEEIASQMKKMLAMTD
jgi:hypothetical protein